MQEMNFKFIFILFVIFYCVYGSEINIYLESTYLNSPIPDSQLFSHNFKEDQKEGNSFWLTLNEKLTKIDGFIDHDLDSVSLGIPANYLKLNEQNQHVNKIFFGRSSSLSEFVICTE